MISGHLLQCEQLILNRLLRLRRVAPLAGPGGPGDKVWLWPRCWPDGSDCNQGRIGNDDFTRPLAFLAWGNAPVLDC
jgi:hypothetical protein